jgi:AcrR family transcriptional regulator
MSRTKYSPEKQKAIMAIFIEAANEIITEEGANAVSIRNVSARAGYSSATLYLYFRDINQLIAMASIGCLRDYVSEISSTMPTLATAKEQYLYTWNAFCRHSFKNPSVFMHLFFNGRAEELGDIVKKYYSIFPNELEDITTHALGMLTAGSLYERNFNILKEYTNEVGIPQDQARIINDLTVCYYRKFLEEANECKHLDEAYCKKLADEFMKGAEYLLK